MGWEWERRKRMGSLHQELGLHQAAKGEPRLPIGEKGSGGASGVGGADGVVKGIDPEGTGRWCLVPGWLCGWTGVSVKSMLSRGGAKETHKGACK